MNLPQLAEAYLCLRIGLSQAHRNDIRSVCRRIHADLGMINGSMPTDSQIVAWLQSQLDAGRSTATVAKYCRLLRAVLRWGEQARVCPTFRLPRVRKPSHQPEAWRPEDIERILAIAARQPGMIGGVPACRWWPALILTVYWTGARIGSILSAPPDAYDPESSTIAIMEPKTGKRKIYRLHRQAAEAIDAIYDPAGDRLFAWPFTKWYLFRKMRNIVEAAGVRSRRGHCDLFHRLRRTCLTFCWAADPSIAQRQADHSSAETTRRHYVDERLLVDRARQAADVLPVLKIDAACESTQLRLFNY